MEAETFDESRNSLVVGYLWDLETHIREASDVIVQGLIFWSLILSRLYLFPDYSQVAMKLSMNAYRSSSHESNEFLGKLRSHW